MVVGDTDEDFTARLFRLAGQIETLGIISDQLKRHQAELTRHLGRGLGDPTALAETLSGQALDVARLVQSELDAAATESVLISQMLGLWGSIAAQGDDGQSAKVARTRPHPDTRGSSSS